MSRRRQTVLPAVLWALAAGLAAFFALESAVARRVGLDLLLPVEAGAFLPGRLARLAACLVVTFALALTDRGRTLGRALDRFGERDRGRWAVAALATALFFLWSLRVTVMSYMTMDEVFLLRHIAQIPEKGMAAVHNALAQTVTEHASPFSILLCWIIGQFYRLDPDGYWYLGYHLAVLLASFTVIGRCVLVKTHVRRWPVWAGCAVYGALCCGVLLYTCSHIAFTVTAAVSGAAATALMLCRHHETRRSGRVLSDVLSGLLMVLCCMQRRATGYCLLCFWALAVAYQVLKNAQTGRGGLKKRLGALGLCAAVTLALIAGVFASARLESDEDYREAEYYRSLVGDYLRENLTYDQYARAGVGPELASLIRGWYYMDESITVDLFRQLAQIYYDDLDARPSEPLFSQVRALTAELGATLWEDASMRWQTGCVLALLLACLAAPLGDGRRCWPELLCALCAAGGAALLLLYLIRDGRFLIRVFLIICVPTAVILLLEALSVPGPAPVPEVTVRRRTAGGIWTGLCAAALAVCCAMGAYTTPHASQAETHADVFALQTAVEQFAGANRDKTIISCVFDHQDINTDPLKRLSAYPDNIVQWGYCGDLAKDPADRLYADAFFRDDVLFMAESPTSAIYLLQYLSLDWGPVQAAVAYKLPSGVTVYDLDQVSPKTADYTGWYEQGGMTYYFRDGQALTGTQTIDGAEYTFTPAGAQSQFSAAPGTDGILYFTNAYSLVSEVNGP